MCKYWFLKLVFYIFLLVFRMFNFFFYRNNGNCSPEGIRSSNDVDRKRIRRPYRSKSYKVEINFASKIPLQAIDKALKGHETDNYQEALRVLDTILRQQAAKQCVFSLIYVILT